MGLGLRSAAMMLTAATVLMLPDQCRAQAVSAPPSAESVVARALTSAKSERKVVLIEFGASWCVWCRSFDNFVHSPDVRQIIADNYIVVNLTVHERDDKKALENAGGEEKMNAWGGKESGLPYYVFLDATGRKIADSNAMPGGANIGFPATPQELEMFLTLLDRTAPRLGKADRSKVVDYLNKTVQR